MGPQGEDGLCDLSVRSRFVYKKRWPFTLTENRDRARRIKCDEGKPFCRRCVSTGRECHGYTETETTTAPVPALEPALVTLPVPGSGLAPVSVPSRGRRLRAKPVPGAARENAHTARDADVSQASVELPGLVSGKIPPHDVDLETVPSWATNQEQDISGLLGALKVDDNGTAPYLRSDSPIAEILDGEDDTLEADHLSKAARRLKPILDSNVPLPMHFMPQDDDVERYISLFFKHVHAYVPVLDEADFHHQWQVDRESISPLILEAIFAVGAQLSGDIEQCCQWLTIFSRHMQSFSIVTRLSTLQALLIALKAREAAPNATYFKRSWATVTRCVRIGKDLGLDEHHDNHKYPFTCQLEPDQCHLQMRIWQTVFVCETMIGAPQGRRNMSVPPESVDLGDPERLVKHSTDSDRLVSRQFACLVRLVWNIRRGNTVYQTHILDAGWGTNPDYLRLEPSMTRFITQLPPDLKCELPADGSKPNLASAFVGNLHSYYYLSLILFHRGVLGFLDPSRHQAQWNYHMEICYRSAKALCRLQEAIIDGFGLIGLQSMQRGFSFTVYACLSCILIHLVAVLSPDPNLNHESRRFLERHVRLVEGVMKVWHMPGLQTQIAAFKEAFSANRQQEPFSLRQPLAGSRKPRRRPSRRGRRTADGSHLDTTQRSLPDALPPPAVPAMWDYAQIAEQWHSLSAAPDPLNFTAMFQQ